MSSYIFVEISRDKMMRLLREYKFIVTVLSIRHTEHFQKALLFACNAIKEGYNVNKQKKIKAYKIECKRQLEREFSDQQEMMPQKVMDAEEK
jgi:hypothetical protein